MPEGDTIHRSANRLRPALAGKPLVRIDAPRAHGRPPKPGTRIEAVEATGKHLRIRFADGTTLRTHMRMTGSWHLYRTGERWRQPAHLARAVVEVDGWVAVCFAAPDVEFERDDLATAHLGPDLNVREPDVDAAVERLLAIGAKREIGDALLDQRIAAGIGNAVKSEVLFALRLSPFVTVDGLERETALRLFAIASKVLRTGTVATRPNAVYGRERQPCPRCGTPIERRRQGELARSTYWCPTCQPRPR